MRCHLKLFSLSKNNVFYCTYATNFYSLMNDMPYFFFYPFIVTLNVVDS